MVLGGSDNSKNDITLKSRKCIYYARKRWKSEGAGKIITFSISNTLWELLNARWIWLYVNIQVGDWMGGKNKMKIEALLRGDVSGNPVGKTSRWGFNFSSVLSPWQLTTIRTKILQNATLQIPIYNMLVFRYNTSIYYAIIITEVAWCIYTLV